MDTFIGSQQFTLLSYNIHQGFTSRYRRFVIDAIRLAIRTVNADLVFLQEVIGDNSHRRRRVQENAWPTMPQFQYLADQVWPHFAYGKNAISDRGDHGNAILSRFPIVSHNNIDITSPRHERRGLLCCNIELPSSVLMNCFCTHFEVYRASRSQQLDKISDLIGSSLHREDPIVLAGDFNDWERRACSVLERQLGVRDVAKVLRGRIQPTFPSFFPILPLDRIYVRGFEVLEVDVLRGNPWSKLSDHLPIYAAVKLSSPRVCCES